jgi:hypothetical protein
MEGLRKLLATIAVLALESGAFVLAAILAKGVDAGMFTTYCIAVAAALAIYTGANVVAKFSPVATEKAKEEPPAP